MEAGAADEQWDDWEPEPEVAAVASGPPEDSEQPPEEDDPFAGLGMAPVVAKTKRHAAVQL